MAAFPAGASRFVFPSTLTSPEPGFVLVRGSGMGFKHNIGATGGHADVTGFSPYLEFKGFSGIADGVDAIRKLIRFEIKNGADLIKLIATAGVLSEEESSGATQYSFEEMKAAVEEASQWGRKVAAHAHGTEGIKMAIRAGVASIEHGPGPAPV
ncbi:MAG: amidohydrolase family protein [Candidatus Aminicenantes bacterium]|nr:amidohydrolase family protein [Candidatus Aminicenantes bacterium]